MSRRQLALLLALAAVVLAGCGGSSNPGPPTIQAAHTYQVIDFKPDGSIEPGKPATISFVIQKPDGTPLTAFKRGPGPHTGVHLIYVRDDLATIIHHHPPIAADGTITDTVTFADPGPYRLVIDVYPATSTSSYHFTISGASHLKAIEAQLVHVEVTDPHGKPTPFQDYYGAMAHAIFFKQGSLDYFHTHVCRPGATGCTSVFGASKVTGTSSKPGKLTVGVLVPVSGTWRLFLQIEVDGHVLTAPFTLDVG
jgi:hypothetical protein